MGSILPLLLVTVATHAAEPRDPVRWQETIDAFLVADKERPTEPGGIVFVGSSSIVMWDLAKSFPDRKPLNRGFGGSEIADSTHYFTELVAKHRPRLVFFYAGDNDVAAGNSADQVYADFQAFLKKFKAELPKAHLVYIAIKPSIARWHLADTMRKANARIAADSGFDDQLTFLDVWPVMLGEDGKPRPDIFLEDGLHMNEQGYALWNELVLPLLTTKQ
jgi:lysophospholipase L1-like esterase